MKHQKTSLAAKISLICLVSTFLFSAHLTFAAVSAPYLATYTAKLVDSSGVPVTTPQSIRFSIWSDSDWDAGDFDGSGNINPSATGYTTWQEIYAVTPNVDGIFTVDLGSITPLPNPVASIHRYLEVDVKPATAPNTSYEVLDPDGNTADLTDRKEMTSTPYAINSDTVDNHAADNTPYNIPVLDSLGKLIYGVIPDAVNADTFTLDQDNNAPSNIVTLQFGNALAQFLRWDNPTNRFEFSSNLNVNGDLSFTGTSNITGATIDGGTNTIQNVPYTAINPHLKSIRLSPAYDSAVLSPDGSDNDGTMKLLHENGGPSDLFNYYNWTTNLAAAQDLDIVVRYQLPTDFVSFDAAPITLTYQTADVLPANNSVDLSLLDSTGAPVTLVGASSLTSAATWTDANVTFTGTPTFTPGSFIEFTIKATSTNGGKYARLGDLILNYNGR